LFKRTNWFDVRKRLSYNKILILRATSILVVVSSGRWPIVNLFCQRESCPFVKRKNTIAIAIPILAGRRCVAVESVDLKEKRMTVITMR
jgi:hypothetical protein